MSQNSLIYELLSETTIIEHDLEQDKEHKLKTDSPRPTTLEYPKSSMHRDKFYDMLGEFYTDLKKQEPSMEILDL